MQMRIYGIAFIFFAISSQLSLVKSLRSTKTAKDVVGSVIADVTHPVEKAIVAAATKNCLYLSKIYLNTMFTEYKIIFKFQAIFSKHYLVLLLMHFMEQSMNQT